jgi:hypothetical protein
MPCKLNLRSSVMSLKWFNDCIATRITNEKPFLALVANERKVKIWLILKIL